MLNNIILVGRLTKDPEVMKTEGEVSVANITLAIDRPFRSSDNVFDTDFIPVSVWRGYADAVANYCKKGSIIGVKGRVQNRPIIIAEKTIQTLEVIAERVSFINLKTNSVNQEEQNASMKEQTKPKKEAKSKTKTEEK